MKGTILLGVMQFWTLHAAILPPPWADPNRNPCANQPGGWLFLFWPPDGKCYRIFQKGHPCPRTMELSPVPSESDLMVAECRCPPRTAQNSITGDCYQIYSQGPCERGQYFAPEQDTNNRQRLGKCVRAETCPSDLLFWPQTAQCYPAFSRGPCPVGHLLTLNSATQLAECKCSTNGTLSQYYWSPTKSCHQYYTRGPCLEKGTLFLPGPTCGCNQRLPNYHDETNQCYEIGGVGPCKPGHRFHLNPNTTKASCMCKPEHVLWSDGLCYRLYTRGPCGPDEIIFNNTTCLNIPCPKGKLYFPADDSCYRVGVKGPCPRGQLVLFEESVRPSLEGISYRGMCGCSGPKCKNQESNTEIEPLASGKNSQNIAPEEKQTSTKHSRDTDYYNDKDENLIRVCEANEEPERKGCFALYSQGPCLKGEWVVPARQGRAARQVHRFRQLNDSPLLFQDKKRIFRGRCECRPGYTKTKDNEGCHLPLIALAKFLNGEDLFR